MEHKFTDDEIIPIDINKYAEALNNLIGVDSAYFNGDKDVDAIVEIITVAKKMEGLINRQKAEIESLKEAYAIYEETTGLKWARAEAIKEFADMLTNNADLITVNHFDSKWAISQDEIDNLVKEMTGE